MRIRQAALPIALVAVLVASLMLVVKTNSRADVAIDEAKLAEARAAHQRRQAARTPAERPPQAQPEPRPRTSRSAPEPEAEPEPPRRQRDRGERRDSLRSERARPTLSEQPGQSSPSGPVEIDDVRNPFDSGNFLEALELAEAYLERDPDQTYIRRIAVTSACAVGQVDTARRFYDEMDERDQRTSQQRCSRWGVEF